MGLLFKTLLLSTLCFGWINAQSIRRISTYPYPDPPGYGMKIEPSVSGPRRERNANASHFDETVVVATPFPEDEIERSFGDVLDHSSVNRMGLAAVEERRHVVPPPRQDVRRRLSSFARTTESSTTLRSFGIPGVLPPSIPDSGGKFGPPAIPGAVQPKPPAPPVLPPSTPLPSLTGTDFGPPSPPDPINSPSPPPGADQAQVTEIKCMKTETTSSFMALLSLPVGYNAIPVFEDRPSVDPTINTACRMIPTQLTNDMFQLVVSDLDRCGVRECRHTNGETWLCLMLRFPLVNGLKLPEDETILIRCRPQDKMESDTHYLTVSTANNDKSPPSVFDGGQQDFRCEIGLFRKLPGTELFASRVTSEVELDLGEEVQLRSIVKAGDGWEYSLLTTIIIQKTGTKRTRSILNAADLVFADGCRNPSYKVIAKNHPKRDPRNPLINNFTFRIFMFQDMDVNEDLMITANVIGCVEAKDCAATECGGVDETDRLGFGRRKKRGVRHYSFTTTLRGSDLMKKSSLGNIPPHPPPNSLHPRSRRVVHDSGENSTTTWERNLNIKVRIPDSGIQHRSMEAHECQMYLFVTLGVAAVFCVASIVFVIVTLFRSRSSPKRHQNPVGHVITTRPNSPGTVSPTPFTVSSAASVCSSSMSSSKETTDSNVNGKSSSSCSPLRNFAVPPTVRQRKRQVNAELLNVFENERLFPYGTYCPGMLNYYGYMVVPRRSTALETTSEKRSLRAIKRDLRKQRIDRLEQQHHLLQQKDDQSHCRCSEGTSSSPHPSTTTKSSFSSSASSSSCAEEPETTSTTASSSSTQNLCNNHKSVIHVPGCQPSPSCPKPMPRMKKEEQEENIYSEIYLQTHPTMV
ncbi:uncharacterized protein LOC135199519 isoform X2 [Macrobrachium nipponense]|uniref:uncharacterized protein LOC135199519 isoform X2 n=1 Tax=Macrobrachium nipponense TaxID=159736 RepID=UPI0030C80A63